MKHAEGYDIVIKHEMQGLESNAYFYHEMQGLESDAYFYYEMHELENDAYFITKCTQLKAMHILLLNALFALHTIYSTN